MLKSILRSTTAIALILVVQAVLPDTAAAGDMAETRLEPVVTPPATLSPFSAWSGAYAGVQIGCSWLDEGNVQSENGPCDMLGGVHFGFNLPPRGEMLLGFEVDYNSIDQDFAGPGTGGYRVSTDWDASLRMRLGYLLGENTLLYGTGGIAFGGARMAGAGSNTHAGWTLGAGVEQAFSERWTGRIELRHYEFGSETYNTPTGPVDVDFGDTRLLLGLSYRF